MILPLAPFPPVPLLDTAISEHRASAYYKKWVRDNTLLGPAVDLYLTGGPRPADTLIGSNHYGKAIVLTEDVRRHG